MFGANLNGPPSIAENTVAVASVMHRDRFITLSPAQLVKASIKRGPGIDHEEWQAEFLL